MLSAKYHRTLDRVLFSAWYNTYDVDDEVWGVVKRLKEKGYRLVFFSNIAEYFFEDARKKYAIIEEFDLVQVCKKAEGYVRKPRPEAYDLVLEKVGGGCDVIFIDDKWRNVAVLEGVPRWVGVHYWMGGKALRSMLERDGVI